MPELRLVVLMQGKHLRADAVPVEQHARDTGVLGGDQIDRSKHLQRAQRDVLQIPQGSGHDI